MKNLASHNRVMNANNLLTYAFEKKSTDEDEVGSKNSASTRISTNSRDSQSQTEMNRDILNRDANTCVFCCRQDPDLTMVAAHIFNKAERKTLDDIQWLETLIELQFVHMYGILNGLCLCSTCHDLYDANLICMKLEGDKYFVECSEAARFDSFCMYREHTQKMHGNEITPKMPELWPPNSLLQHRWQRYLEYLGMIRTNMDEQYRCPECGRLFKNSRGLVSHYKTPSCSKQRNEIFTVGKHIFKTVRFPDKDRDDKSRRVLVEAKKIIAAQEMGEALQDISI